MPICIEIDNKIISNIGLIVRIIVAVCCIGQYLIDDLTTKAAEGVADTGLLAWAP